MPQDFYSEDDFRLALDKKALIIVAIVVILGLFFGSSLLRNISSTSSELTYRENYPYQRTAPLQDFVWIAYPIFLVGGYFFVVLTKKFVSKAESDFALALSLAGAFLLFVSVLTLLLLTPFIQSLGVEGNAKVGWIAQTAIFAVVGFALAFAGKKLNSGKTPVSAIISLSIAPVLYLSSAALLALGLRDFITYEMPSWVAIPLSVEARFGWIVSFLVMLTLTLISATYLLKKAGKKSLIAFMQSLKITGWIFVVVALMIFVAGILGTNFAEFEISGFLKTILEPVAYAAIGGLSLLGLKKL